MKLNTDFTGPESVERLRSSFTDDWRIELGPLKSEVSFLFPVPDHDNCEEPDYSIALGINELSDRHKIDYRVGREPRKSEIDGRQVTYWLLSAPWPLQHELIVSLHGVRDRILNSWPDS